MTGQFVQSAVPPFRMSIAVFNSAKAFLAQRQLRLASQVFERDRDERLSLVIALPSPGEDQALRLVDRPEDAGNG